MGYMHVHVMIGYASKIYTCSSCARAIYTHVHLMTGYARAIYGGLCTFIYDGCIWTCNLFEQRELHLVLDVCVNFLSTAAHSSNLGMHNFFFEKYKCFVEY